MVFSIGHLPAQAPQKLESEVGREPIRAVAAMHIDIHQTYFMMSFRFDKTKPEDFGLLASTDQPGEFRKPADGSRWIQKNLYDFGWGNEYGFVRLPELDFEQLWHLSIHSGIRENRYGAVFELENRCGPELLNLLWEVFYHNAPVPASFWRAFEIMDLNKVHHYDGLTVKSVGELEAEESEDNKWRYVSRKIEAMKNRENNRKKLRRGIRYGAVFLVVALLMIGAGYLLIAKSREAQRIKAALQHSGLAALPHTARILGVAGSGRDPADPLLLKFTLPRSRIERFIRDCRGLRSARPAPFFYSQWYNTHLRSLHKYDWFDPATAKGRLYKITRGKKGATARLIIDDADGMVYIEVIQER